MKTITIFCLSSIILFSCASNIPTESNDLTLGTVQSKIYKGQSQSSVMDFLGSPNIVTKDNQEREEQKDTEETSERKNLNLIENI